MTIELIENTVPIPMDSDRSTHWECCSWKFGFFDVWTFPVDATDNARAPGTFHVLAPVHAEHCNVQPVAVSNRALSNPESITNEDLQGYGFSSFPSNHAGNLSTFYDPDLSPRFL